MTETPVEVKVVQPQQKKKGRLSRVKSFLSGQEQALGTIKESERFSNAGLFKLPERLQLDYRLTKLTNILEEIESDLDKVKTTEQEKRYAFQHIHKLFKAFMLLGAPWFRGLNNRELSKKAVTFYKLESMVGHLSSFYPDLKRCVEALLTLSWQAIDVTPDTTVLFESHVNVQSPHGGINLTGEDNAKRSGRTEET